MLGAGQRTPLKSIEIVGATWSRPRPLSGKIIRALARHFWYKAVYHMWSL